MRDRGDEDKPPQAVEPAFGRSHHEQAYMRELGHRLRTLREERGLTQQALARAAGVATDMVSRLENGRYSSPGLRTLLRVADGLGLPLSTLLPSLDLVPHTSPDRSLRSRLALVAQRLDVDDLELLLDIAQAIVSRRRH